MLERKPRRIRDIAHLYLSRKESDATVPEPRRVLARAGGRYLFPGFHIANIAAALSARGTSVRLFELSGLQPNAAFFLAMPPRVYLDRPLEGQGAWISALGGVRVTMSGDESLREAGRVNGPCVDIVHLPPDPRPRGAGRPLARPSPQAAERDGIEIEFTDGEAERSVRYTLGPSVHSGPRVVSEQSIRTGVLERWQRGLTDPVPAVFRDRDSMLARAYDAIAGHILKWREPGREVEQDGAPVTRTWARRVRRESFRSG